MALNCSEIELILKEMNLEYSFIQKVIQSSYNTLAFSLYQQGGRGSFNLLFNFENSNPRFHITEKKLRKTEKPLRFMELLRSKIIGWYIESAEQLNANRIIKFILKNVHNDDTLFLYVRLWSGASNIIFTHSNNIIIDALYRRPAKKEITGELFYEEQPLSPELIQERLTKFPVRTIPDGCTLNQLIDKEITNENSTVTIETLKKEITQHYTEKIANLNDLKRKLTTQLSHFESPEVLKQYGSILLMNAHTIKNNTEYFNTIDYNTNKPISIKLNTNKTIAENANDYYAQAKKIISGQHTIYENMKSIDKQIQQIDLELQVVQKEDNLDVLKKIKEKILGTHAKKILKTSHEKKFTGLRFNIDGFLVMVGRSASENDELLRHCVRGSDMWLHVRDYSGCYVFIKSQNKKTIPLNVLVAAGNLAVYYSKAKKAEDASVYYTEVKNLKRIKGAKLGTVIPEHEKTIQIKLDKNILEKNEMARIL